MKAVIVLGCEKYQESGFHFCNGVENIVLDLEAERRSENYFNLIKYLDGVVKIFDGPCNKTHIISNAIYKFFEWEYITEKQLHQIGLFIQLHRKCSLLMEAKSKEE